MLYSLYIQRNTNRESPYQHSFYIEGAGFEFTEVTSSNFDRVTDILGEAPPLFAYPNGWFGRDFTAEHQHMLNELGIQYGVATNDGGITSKTSLTALPRFMPHRKEFNQFCLSILKIAGE